MKKRSVEILLVVSVILISIFGIIMIYSASSIWAEYKYNNPYKYVISQIIFLIIGIFLMKLFRKIDYNIFIHGQVRVNDLTDVDKENLKVFLNKQNLKLIDLGLFKEEEVCDKASKLVEEIKKSDDKGKISILLKENGIFELDNKIKNMIIEAKNSVRDEIDNLNREKNANDLYGRQFQNIYFINKQI